MTLWKPVYKGDRAARVSPWMPRTKTKSMPLYSGPLSKIADNRWKVYFPACFNHRNIGNPFFAMKNLEYHKIITTAVANPSAIIKRTPLWHYNKYNVSVSVMETVSWVKALQTLSESDPWVHSWQMCMLRVDCVSHNNPFKIDTMSEGISKTYTSHIQTQRTYVYFWKSLRLSRECRRRTRSTPDQTTLTARQQKTQRGKIRSHAQHGLRATMEEHYSTVVRHRRNGMYPARSCNVDDVWEMISKESPWYCVSDSAIYHLTHE